MAESQNKKVKRQEKAAPVVDTEDAEEAPTTLMAADLVEEGDDDTLNVSFNAFQPIGDDFWGIKTLLQQMMPRADADLGELARTIIDKAEQSTVIKVEQDPTSGIVASDKAAQAAAQEAASDAVDGATDEDPDGAYDVYAVMSPLRMGDIKKSSWLRALKQWLAKHISDMDFKTQLAAALKNSNNLLLIAERFINLPPQLAVGLYNSLVQDLDTAVQAGQAATPTQVVMIIKAWKERGASGNEAPLNFSCEEDEQFSAVALHRAAFEVSVVQDSEGSYPYRAFRQCLVLDYETFAKTARQLGEMYTTVYEDVEDGEDDE